MTLLTLLRGGAAGGPAGITGTGSVQPGGPAVAGTGTNSAAVIMTATPGTVTNGALGVVVSLVGTNTNWVAQTFDVTIGPATKVTQAITDTTHASITLNITGTGAITLSDGSITTVIQAVAPSVGAPIWTLPRTWALSEKVPAHLLNTYVRDNPLNLRHLLGCSARVYLTDNQSIEEARRAPINWDIAAWTFGGVWESGSHLVAPVTGYYLLLVSVEWANDPDGIRGIGWRVNERSTAHDLQFQDTTASGTPVLSGGEVFKLQAEEFVEVYGYQNSTQGIDVHGGTEDRTRATLTLIATD